MALWTCDQALILPTNPKHSQRVFFVVGPKAGLVVQIGLYGPRTRSFQAVLWESLLLCPIAASWNK
jgi:hypothetical protein